MWCSKACCSVCVVVLGALGLHLHKLVRGPGGIFYTVRAVYFHERTGNDGSYGATSVPELTAEEVTVGANFSGRVAIVTGANAGIGLEMSRVMAMRGMRVVMACRSKPRCEQARAQLQPWAAMGGSLQTMALDLSDLSSVKRFADEFLATGLPLHFLVNNAGMIPEGYEESAQGIELTYAVNTLAPFFLTRLLLPRARQSAPSRIINVGSVGQNFADKSSWAQIQQPLARDAFYKQGLYPVPHPLSFNMMNVYGLTKTSMALITTELRRQLAGSGVEAAIVHPGMIETNITAHLALDSYFMIQLPKYTDALGLTHIVKTTPQGASTVLWTMVNDISSSVFYADNAPHDGNIPKVNPEIYLNGTLATAEWRSHEALLKRTISGYEGMVESVL